MAVEVKTQRGSLMRAAARRRFGPPDVVAVEDVAVPAVASNGVLVRVRAASVNRMDWYSMMGTPYIGRPGLGLVAPRSPLFGVDFAGTVEAVGSGVNQFRPGDEVFGAKRGAFAEYVCVPEDRAVVVKPANLTFEEAAAVPVAATTALQGLRDKGRVKPGQRVLINGASGGVGLFAVQIAKALGAEVTAVCSTTHVDLVRSLGADRVIDYMREDFTRGGERYDLMFDIAGSRSWSACRRILEPHGAQVMVGAPGGNRWVGPLGHMIAVRLAALRDTRKAFVFVATMNKADMTALRELLETGAVKPVIEQRHALSDVAEALRHVGEGHAHSKTVIIM